MSDESRKEREILVVMRKVLAQIIKDTTPPSRAMRHPLSDQTIQDIRACLGLISARERELADAAGIPVEKPYYADEKPAAEVVPIDRIQRPPKDD
ncbi:MAG TPA: segregation and condensation protein A [Gammaproteobacteria bacterium]|nr:segregation and condensation protein A [Gammaproteobacteria bacterium]